jgi:hypothetical protein
MGMHAGARSIFFDVGSYLREWVRAWARPSLRHRIIRCNQQTYLVNQREAKPIALC